MIILNEPIKGKIIEIQELDYNTDYVYDISVENNHNFFANNILVSNCHHIASDTFVNISKWAKDAYYRIGVSATPWREDGADMLLEAALNKKNENNNISASKLIQLGYLVPCTIYFVPIKQIFKGKNYNKLYKDAIVNNTERNMIACKIALKMYKTKNATILMLIQQVEHGENLLNILSKYMNIEKKAISVKDPKTQKDTLVMVSNIEFLSGKDKPLKREAVKQGVKDGFVKILIGSTIADEGLDLPNLNCLILLGAGKSSTRAFQRIGRVLRLFTDPITGKKKERAVIFDFQDYTPMLRRHSRKREKLYRTEELWEIKKFNVNSLN